MKHDVKEALYLFIVGACCGLTAISAYILWGGGIQHFLRAAGVNTGAADVNARYLDGYGTATATSSTKIYISDASGYLPDGSVDNGALVGSIDPSKITGTAWTSSNDGAGSGLDADLLDGSQGTSYLWPTDISCGAGFTNVGTYCIQTDEAGSATWWNAADYCRDNYGARLCSVSEWYGACINSLLTNGTDDYEWVDDWHDYSHVLKFGNGSCSTVSSFDDPGYSYAFRCCK